MVVAYTQKAGTSSGDRLFRYRDSASYGVVPYAYMVELPPNLGSAINSTNAPVYANPNSFQLIAPGLDGEVGVPFPGENSPTELQNQLRASALPAAGAVLDEVQGVDDTWRASDANFAADNMANFANGRLELFWIENGFE